MKTLLSSLVLALLVLLACLPSPARAEDEPARRSEEGLITLRLDQVELSQAMRQIGERAGASIVVAPGLAGRITLYVERVALRTVLEMVAHQVDAEVLIDSAGVFRLQMPDRSEQVVEVLDIRDLVGPDGPGTLIQALVEVAPEAGFDAHGQGNLVVRALESELPRIHKVLDAWRQRRAAEVRAAGPAASEAQRVTLDVTDLGLVPSQWNALSAEHAPDAHIEWLGSGRMIMGISGSPAAVEQMLRVISDQRRRHVQSERGQQMLTRLVEIASQAHASGDHGRARSYLEKALELDPGLAQREVEVARLREALGPTGPRVEPAPMPPGGGADAHHRERLQKRCAQLEQTLEELSRVHGLLLDSGQPRAAAEIAEQIDALRRDLAEARAAAGLPPQGPHRAPPGGDPSADLRAEVDALRAEVERLRQELQALRERLDR